MRNFTRPRTSPSLLRGSVSANERTSWMVTTAISLNSARGYARSRAALGGYVGAGLARARHARNRRALRRERALAAASVPRARGRRPRRGHLERGNETHRRRQRRPRRRVPAALRSGGARRRAARHLGRPVVQKTVAQSFLMLTTVQPSLAACSRAASAPEV